ncbi:outer membrane beta-barrel domain-containing protein [bacterium]|nr:outer membrane beta-barrel domain-containing protein [bacterium]
MNLFGVSIKTALFYFFAFGVAFNGQAQSLEELEREILQGGTSTPSYNSSSASSEAPEWEGSGASTESEESASLPRKTEIEERTKPSQDELEFEEIKAKESALEEVDEIVRGPRQIPFEHIFVVQHRYIRKRNTHELTPLVLGVQPADSFRKQLQLGFSYIYNFSESFGIEALHLTATTNIKTGLSENLLKNARLETERVEPVLSAGASLQWAPFKSKAATIESIYHFEGYMLLGGGYTKFENGGSAMVMGGGGIRIFLNPRAMLKTEVRDYYDFDNASDHRVNILVGAAFLLGGEDR